MKVDLFESGKEGRAGERGLLAVLTSWVEQAQAGPPGNKAVVQGQCGSVETKP